MSRLVDQQLAWRHLVGRVRRVVPGSGGRRSRWLAPATSAVALAATLAMVLSITSTSPALAGTATPAKPPTHGTKLEPDAKPAKVTTPSRAHLPGISASQKKAEEQAVAKHPVRWPSAETLTDTNKAPSTPHPIRIHANRSGERAAGQVVSHDRVAKAGIRGAAVRLARPAHSGTTPGNPPPGDSTQVQMNYTDFADGYGAGWVGRLAAAVYPACVLTTPKVASCARGHALKTTHDTAKQTISVTVPTSALAPTATTASTATSDGPVASSGAAATTPDLSAASVVVFAAAASSSTGGGDFSATSLSPSSSWEAGGQNGGFSWSYPLRTVPTLNGPAPDLSVGYSSQEADGRTGGSNNQTGPLGEGFSIGESYIERGYVSCDDDGSSGHFDLCWKNDNATVVLNGVSNRLVKAADGSWRLSSDDGSRVEHLTSTNTANRDNDHEYWVLTQPDGTKYYFGRVSVPQESGSTNSVLTAPVFGNDAGDPCHADTFAASVCDQAWRWELSYVVDPEGNAMSLWYTPETNYYLATGGARQYDRAADLNEIRYGLRDDATATQTAPEKVVFNNSLRCTGTGTDCDTHTKAMWPDTPYDQVCNSGDACTGNTSPTFFSRYRLGSVTSQVLKSGAYESVDSWTFDSTFLSYGTADDSILWLNSITRKGLVGGTTTLPAVKFAAVELSNRIDGAPGAEGLTPLPRPRLRTITSETGSVTTINYGGGSDCTPDNLMDPDRNTRTCFPQRWTPPGYTSPVQDWFYKYLVGSVTEADTTGLGQDVTTSYTYSGGAGWAYNNDKMVPDKDRTWSIWRGYQTVTTTIGSGSGAQSQQTDTYFRGLDGDKQADGTTRSASVTDSAGNSHTDSKRLAGMRLESVTKDGPGGKVMSGVITTPWTKLTAGTAGTPDSAFFRSNYTSETRQRVSAAETGTGAGQYPDGFRREKSTTSYDPDTGQPIRISDTGDENVSGDETCNATDYADAPSAASWLIGFPARVVTSKGACGDSALTPDKAHFLSETRTSYDGQDPGVAPTKGLVTKNERVDSYTDDNTPHYQITAQTTFDKWGRATSVTKPVTVNGVDTTTTDKTDYVQSSDGTLASETVTENATTGSAAGKAFTTTTTYAPEWQSALQVTDANSHRTRGTYDPMGRVSQVWLPTRGDTGTPNTTFTYNITQTVPSSVVTKTLNADATGYRTSVVLYDSLLRQRETQTASPTGGRIIDTTAYDDRGLAYEQANGVYTDGDPGTDFVQFEEAAIPDKTVTTYDGLGRPTRSTFTTYNVDRWHTTTSYDGMDVTTVTPPKGGATTVTRTDIHGNTVASTEKGSASDPTAAGQKDLTTTSTYDVTGNLTKLVSPAGTWTYDYDLLGRVTTTHDPDAGDTTVTYSADDQVATSIDARGQGTLSYHDALGRPTYRYAITSDNTTASDDNLLAQWTYDSLAKGQPTATGRYIGGKGGQLIVNKVTSYDPDYQPTGTSMTISNPADDAGTKDPLPDLTKILPTDLSQTYAYYADESEHQHTVPKVATTAAGTVLSAETLTLAYDQLGDPKSLQGRTALVQNTDYDQFGNPTEYVLGTGSASQVYVDNEYDQGTNRLMRQLVTTSASTTSVADHAYAYDDSGNLLEDGDPVTGDYQCYTYDAHVRLTSTWTPASHPTVGATQPLADECKTAPSATQAAAAGAGLLGGPAAYWQGWTFDTNTGLRASQTTVAPAVSADGGAAAQTVTDAYTYPAQGQAHANFATSISRDTVTTPAAGGDPTEKSQTLSYSADAVGDATARPDPAATSGTGSTSGAGEQSLTWDAEGNLETLTRPAGAGDGATGDAATDPGGTTRYVYDTNGDLLLTDTPSKVVLYDGETQITYTKNASSGESLTAERDYDTFAGPIATRTGNADADIDYLVPNAQGTASLSLEGATLAPTRRWFTPYGETRGAGDGSGGASTWPNQRGFLAAPADPDTGLTSLGQRQYDASTGRFVSPDPLLDTSDSAQMLGYQYADNNPVGNADPTGEAPTCVLEGTCAADPKGYPTGPPAPYIPPSSYQSTSNTSSGGNDSSGGSGKTFSTGLVKGGGAELAELADSVNPMVIGRGIKQMIADPPNPWEMFKSVVKGMLHYDELKGIYNAWRNHDSYKAGYYLGKLIVDAGSQILLDVVSAGAGAVAAKAMEKAVTSSERAAKAAEAAAKKTAHAGGCNSFTGLTPVLMADGSLVPIEDVEIGDLVEATNPRTGESGARPVTNLIRHSGPHTIVTVALADGTSIDATDHHPFWVTNHGPRGGWIDAVNINIGDTLQTSAGTRVMITAIDVWQADLTAYNLTVDDLHTYYAGIDAVLVHNTSKRCSVDAAGNPPPNLSPRGAGRRGAFRQAKRDSGVPVSMNPTRVGPNLDRRGKVQPGRLYEFDVRGAGGARRTVGIREDSEGHVFPDDPTQDRGPHFNTMDGGHYDY